MCYSCSISKILKFFLKKPRKLGKKIHISESNNKNLKKNLVLLLKLV